MKRSPSRLAQLSFDTVTRLQLLSLNSTFATSFLARAMARALKPISRSLGANHIVTASLYGHRLAMPAEHPLAPTLMQFPQYNRPLGLAMEAIGKFHTGSSNMAVIDVGANIGETVAIIEQHCPARSTYLCLDADQDIIELCALNHAENPRVLVQQGFIGEQEGAPVLLQDDGRANPSTILAVGGKAAAGRLTRLDSIANSFARANGGLSLIKIDTEGFEFSVLRSAQTLLQEYRPAVYFEWFPRLLKNFGEEVWTGFEYLQSLGYRDFVVFTNRGDYYCKFSDPDRLLLRSLASVAMADESLGYFDVFASTQAEVCSQLVEASLAILDKEGLGKAAQRS